MLRGATITRSTERVSRRVRAGGRLLPASVRDLARARGIGVETADDDLRHPERLAVLDNVLGPRVLEVGCGPRKTSPEFIAVDLTPGRRPGTVGNARHRLSQADVAASGEHLPFASGWADSVVARHNLEHYLDTVATLREWARVVRQGGRLVIVVPDEEGYDGRTVLLDDTHFHAFSTASLANLLPLVGWEPEIVVPCVAGWSLLAVAERTR